MGSTAMGLNERQILHRNIWRKKPAIRLIYRDFHRQLLEGCGQGRILDIGSGTAHIKDFRSDIVSMDILSFPGIDVVADAHQLPFPDECFAAIVMLDVLHHLEHPIVFLKEASRILKVGGRLAMIEPAMTPLARRFYDHFHEEPVDMSVDPFAVGASDPYRDPFDANQAVPSLLFSTDPARKRVEQTVPSLFVRSVDWLSLIAYPLSGGFQEWSLIPAAMVGPTLAFENKVPLLIRKVLAFRMMVVVQRR
jgi:SAM-dependent methyltransferase